MSPAEVRQLLADVQGGAVSAEAAFARLSEPAVGDLGFATASHFGELFHRRFGMTPKAYRQAGRSGSPTD